MEIEGMGKIGQGERGSRERANRLGVKKRR